MISDKVKNLSNTVLLLLMLMAVYSHYMVNDKFERIAPALVSDRWHCWSNFVSRKLEKWFQVFFFMLTGRLVIDWQLRRENAQSVTANGVDDKAKKQDWAKLQLENACSPVSTLTHLIPLCRFWNTVILADSIYFKHIFLSLSSPRPIIQRMISYYVLK